MADTDPRYKRETLAIVAKDYEVISHSYYEMDPDGDIIEIRRKGAGPGSTSNILLFRGKYHELDDLLTVLLWWRDYYPERGNNVRD